MSQILDGTTDSLIHLARVERETERQLRAALLRLGRYLDWDGRVVIRFSEAVTGRPWSRCGAAQVVQVGRALLDLAVAVRAGNPSAATPGLTSDQRSTFRAVHRTCATCSLWKSVETTVVTNCDGCSSTDEQEGD